jgi:hypothetical protein
MSLPSIATISFPVCGNEGESLFRSLGDELLREIRRAQVGEELGYPSLWHPLSTVDGF